MAATIRPGALADVEACVDIIQTWSAETPWLDPLNPRPELLTFWRDLFQTDLTWVALRDDRVVGFCTRDDDNIGALYVTTDHRSTGIGKALLDRAKADRDWITVWVYALNTRALAFYRREGLVEISREIEAHSQLENVEHRWVRPS